MKPSRLITIRPVRNPDDGATVYHWQVTAGRTLLGGGYCATYSGAHNDATVFVLSLG